MLKEIANKIFDLFVVNRNAIAIQNDNGSYCTKYQRVTEYDIYLMLKKRKALGTYQQLYKKPYVKWICFDFDCRDKENSDVSGLYNDCTLALCNYLKENEIYFVNEFSGRRGIHTWILFDDYLSKKTAYEVLKAIKKGAKIDFDEKKYGLDEFPKTPVSKGNKLGLQVKIPLSVHRKGKQSFLFIDQCKNEYTELFFEEQLTILKSIKRNSRNDILKKFGIDEKNNAFFTPFQKSYAAGEDGWTLPEIKEILSKIEVYREIFYRFEHGEPLLKDRYVMLGTLGKLPDGVNMLMELFQYCPNFSQEITQKEISRNKDKYFPPTFRYLYDMYDMTMEKNIDPNDNALSFLVKNTDKNIEVRILETSEKNTLESSLYTLKKEMNYLLINDEVPVITVLLNMKNMTLYDINTIDQKVNSIKGGTDTEHEHEVPYVFIRHESESKFRKMIVLSAYDRVLTSHLALNLCYNLNKNMRSFSYNPNYLSDRDMFYHWYHSWGNYIASISKFIQNDMYDDMCVITMDIRHFYDSIDFLSVYNLLKNCLSKEECNILKWLITYNEKLMKDINDDQQRIGVPQGPAYARIISELFLGMMIKKILKSFDEETASGMIIYRYVDDIIIFHADSIDSFEILERFKDTFIENKLILNDDKTHIHGRIKDINEKQKENILRSNQFQYGLKKNDNFYLIETEYIHRKLREVVDKKGGFKIEDLSYYFSVFTDDHAKNYCFYQYADQIVTAFQGRGSGYFCFYKYVMENIDILNVFVNRKYYDRIPINTLNFSCFLAQLFFMVSEKANYVSLRQIIKDYIFRLYDDLERIQSNEDKSIILALREYDKVMED